MSARAPTETAYRLPRNAVPRHYAITLEPDMAAATFTGTVAIDLAVREPSRSVIFNTAELELMNGTLTNATSGAVIEGDLATDEEAERTTFTPADTIAPGDYTLRLEFTGVLNDQLRGFYRSVYKDDDGDEHVLATTQFEATDARRAFPCWDEPDLKATFDVTLIVDSDHLAVSNAAVESEEMLADGRRRVAFATTMKMSTYLVAFVVGSLEATEPIDVDGVPLRVVHVPGKSHLTGFALEAGAFALRFFTDYYGSPYPGDKLDMIGIPDFAFGAMENLGAVTYRENLLLIDPAKATQAEMMSVADVIAHELAHMWFGDLVTMKWWNGIWLNEAFATFMEITCVDAFRPEWKRWLAFCAERVASYEIDGLASTRPVEFPVASPDEANAMFDVLTYQKGSSVLRMLEQYLGAETFRDGIRLYLRNHAHGNTETEDLWKALGEASGEPVAEMMQRWIFQGGHPQIEVGSDDDGYRLSQRHFQFIGDPDKRWMVPVVYRSSIGTGRVIVEDPVTVAAGERFIVNAGGDGYYRVRYNAGLIDEVAANISELDAAERFTVVSDTWANVLAGDSPAQAFLTVVTRLSGEREATVWGPILGGLGELNRVVSSDNRPQLRAFVRDLVRPGLDAMEWAPRAGETDLERKLRGILIGAMGGLGKDGATIERARSMLPAVMAPDSDIDAEVASAVVRVVAANGDVADHASFAKAYETATTPQDERRYLGAMAVVPDRDASRETLAMVLDGRIRSQDAGLTVSMLIGNRITGVEAWEAVRTHWDDVLARMPSMTRRHALRSIHLRSEPEVAADIESWLADHPIAGAEKYTEQQLERLEIRVRLREREGDLEVNSPTPLDV